MNRSGSCWSAAALVFSSLLLLSADAPGEETAKQPERVEIGQEAPLFVLESLDGASMSLEDLRGVTPLVLIYFRGTW